MKNRFDIALYFDVSDGNPNGDPECGGRPRTDPQTGHGIVLDVCLKRKVRNYVALTQENVPGRDIYVYERAVLNHQNQRAYTATGLDPKVAKADAVAATRAWMAKNFFDIRAFGAVMSTAVNCGQVRGPVQVAVARTIDPVVVCDHTITRCAVATERESVAQDGENHTFGHKYTIPYGLFCAHIFINPFLAKQTGFDESDLALFKEALLQMFELDRSASRGLMSVQRCLAFKHDSALGNAPAHKLFGFVKAAKNVGVEVPRAFSDYTISLDTAAVPKGVTVEEWA
jgi:CRISPR-associated protein Csd2